MFKERLLQLKKILKDKKADFYILPNSDEFFCEYLPESEKRIEFLTGFNGSNAQIVFGHKKSYFFTDSRYILQAKNQLDSSEFEIINMAENSLLNWLRENATDRKILLDEKLFSIDFIENLQKINQNIIFSDDLVAKIWINRPKKPNSDVFLLKNAVCGENSLKKRQKITENLKSDALLITKAENICYLLNIRAADIEFSPFLLAYGILYKDGKVDLFVDEGCFKGEKISGVNFINLRKNDPASNQEQAPSSILPQGEDENLEILEKGESNILSNIILPLREDRRAQRFEEGSISVVKKTTNFAIFKMLQKANLKIDFVTDEIENLRAVKNKIEINGAIKSHEIDGRAVTKFLKWLDKKIANDEEITEISAAAKLLEFRKCAPEFLYESFNAISGFSSNGAIIHYAVNEKTNKTLRQNQSDKFGSLYLVDSGGQYLGEDFYGTTDITRTIAIGTPSPEMIADFTRVLKGHIAIARAKFPRGTSGAQLDSLARFHLWQAGKDYGHGTGHGVGSFLSVHEGPCGISKNAHAPLKEGMILSNEPGFYQEGEYGIRIENLMLVEKFNDEFLCFKTLTKAPIDEKLIDFKMLTYPEKKWLEKYALEVVGNSES